MGSKTLRQFKRHPQRGASGIPARNRHELLTEYGYSTALTRTKSNHPALIFPFTVFQVGNYRQPCCSRQLSSVLLAVFMDATRRSYAHRRSSSSSSPLSSSPSSSFERRTTWNTTPNQRNGTREEECATRGSEPPTRSSLPQRLRCDLAACGTSVTSKFVTDREGRTCATFATALEISLCLCD